MMVYRSYPTGNSFLLLKWCVEKHLKKNEEKFKKKFNSKQDGSVITAARKSNACREIFVTVVALTAHISAAIHLHCRQPMPVILHWPFSIIDYLG
jgi:hypothetical protein